MMDPSAVLIVSVADDTSHLTALASLDTSPSVPMTTASVCGVAFDGLSMNLIFDMIRRCPIMGCAANRPT